MIAVLLFALRMMPSKQVMDVPLENAEVTLTVAVEEIVSEDMLFTTMLNNPTLLMELRLLPVLKVTSLPSLSSHLSTPESTVQVITASLFRHTAESAKLVLKPVTADKESKIIIYIYIYCFEFHYLSLS